MKTISALILFIAFSLQSCREEESMIHQAEKIQFSLGFVSDDHSGGRINSTSPKGASILISLIDNSGVSVVTHHKIALLKAGEAYITEPLELKRGFYKITDFMVVNESSEVLYVTPKRGSALAPIVKNPLPYGLGVGSNLVKNILMEVVDVQQTAPEDFGYTSFNLEVVHPWRLAVFIIKDRKVMFTEADAFLSINGVEHYRYPVKSKINLLPFKGDTEVTYTLLVTKDGYKDYTQEFKYSEIKEQLGTKPIKVILQDELAAEALLTITPAETIVPQETLYGFAIDFIPPLSITVDWGDGESESLYFENQKFADFSHNYKNGFFPIVVTGDLNKIWHFSNDAAAAINTSFLTELKELSVYRGDMVTLDLSSNSKLIKMIFTTCSADKLILPSRHNISEVIMDGFTTDNIDQVIDNIYNNAVSKSIKDGRFYIDVSQAPSSSSSDKLQILQDTYLWHVTIK